jgi:cytochrome c-type biogenesis protein CcmF
MGPRFFNSMAGIPSLALLFLTGVGPLIAWRRATWSSIRRQFRLPATVGSLCAVALSASFWGQIGFWTLASISLGSFVTTTIAQEYAMAIRARVGRRGESVSEALWFLLRRNQRRYGGYVVHLGIVLILVGIAGSGFNQEKLENVRPGDSTSLARYRFDYLTADPIPAQHYGGAKAQIALFRDEKPLAMMVPEKRVYWLEQQPTSIPSIYSTWLEDVYVILSQVEADGSATLKIHRNPLVNWIWLGGLVMVVGNLLVMWPHPVPREAAAA